jgi:predicted metal-binding protein
LAIKEFLQQLGIEICIEINPDILVPEERIRAFCLENKCGNYGNNYTCPPYTGSLEEIKNKLKQFRKGLLLQYSKEIDVKGNKEEVIQTKIDFHNKILKAEEFLREKGINQVWGMIGGNCGLCTTCKVKTNEPCPYPEKARVSLEAIAVDVVGLLDKLGLDSRFHKDKITWTGCILF